jgi:hypothetical protein
MRTAMVVVIAPGFMVSRASVGLRKICSLRHQVIRATPDRRTWARSEVFLSSKIWPGSTNR